MPSVATFGDANRGFQAGVIHGSVNTTFQFPPGLDSPLSQLPYATDAPFNSYSKQHEPNCLQNTRVDVLEKIYRWAGAQDTRCIFWLNGLAGTGKSTIARTVARRYFDQKRLGASFFFSRGGGDVGYANKFVTSIAFQLASSIPSLHQHICNAITERHDITILSFRDQWRHLVLYPLLKLEGPSPYILVVDALDECDDENNIRIIVQLLAETRLLEKTRLRVFLTSRSEVPIRYGFFQIPDTEHQNFVLHSISPSIVDHDISCFLKYSLNLIGHEQMLGDGWPDAESVKTLVYNAGGLFIWAATACRFISEGPFAEERLRTIIGGFTSTVLKEHANELEGSTVTPEHHLSRIYTAVLQSSIRLGFTRQETQEVYTRLRYVLGSVVVLISPLSIKSLTRLLSITEHEVGQTLKSLHAIIDIPKDQTHSLRLHHPSFRDFLIDKGRCGDANFWVDEKQVHQTLADNCINLMATSLKQNICGVSAPGMLVADIQKSQVERSLPPELQYACLYWPQHLQKSNAQPKDNDQVHQFLQKHLLHWLEALGWMGKVPEGVHAIISLELFVSSSQCPSLLSLIHDAKRFVLYSRAAIERAPLQTYSGLVFAPTMSLVRKTFKSCIPRWIRRLPKVEERWKALLQTLEGHSHSVNSVAFSHDSTRLASASYDCIVKIWDASSDVCLQTLNIRHTLRSISFDATGSCLSTDIGLIHISSSADPNTTTVATPQPPQFQYTALSWDNVWITFDSKNLLWLPQEYRPSCSAMSGNRIGIGAGSGRVWVCTIDPQETFLVMRK